MAVNPADVCLLLLSIVNKDLLFLIIESYDCNLMIRSYNTILAHSGRPRCLLVPPLFWSFHTVICWPLVICKQTGGLVWLPTASLQTWLCVCAGDIRSQTGLCFQGWCFSPCGIWAANLSVCGSDLPSTTVFHWAAWEKAWWRTTKPDPLLCLFCLLWPNPDEPELRSSLWIQRAHGSAIKSIHGVLC